MRRLASLIGIVAWAAGCGDQPPPASVPAPAPETGQMTCAGGFSFSDDRTHFGRGWRDRAVVAGPLTFLRLGALHGEDLSRRRALLIKAIVEPHAPATTIAVAPEDRGHVSLSAHVPADPFEPPDGDPALRMEGCAPRTDDSVEGEELGTGYGFAVIAEGPRCATFEITPEGGDTVRREVGLGVRECPAPTVMDCAAGWTYPDRRYFKGSWREASLTAGPITLLWLNGRHDEDFSRPRALYTKVVLAPRRTTTLAVAAEDRDWVRVDTRPPNDEFAAAGGGAAITFEGCPSRAELSPEPGTGYAFAVMVDRPGCATFEITPKGGATRRRQVAFGRRDCR